MAHALLDSPSVAGAYRFGLYPGEVTAMEVSATLFPRTALTHVGLGPLTSMYYFGWLGRQGVDDFRPEVHDSDGLAIRTGRGESIWRPLANPRTLQASAFVDENPRGFGLLQRARTLDRYQDLEANYERRPSLWVEPQGQWGRGWVELIEIPTDSEVNDNIVAYWRPEAAIPAGRPFELAYTLSWCTEPPGAPPLARVAQSRSGRRESGVRLFVIDYEGGPLAGLAAIDGVTVEASASAGRIDNIVRQPLPGGRGVRVSFDLDVADAQLVELRVAPHLASAPAGETWLYRWTA